MPDLERQIYDIRNISQGLYYPGFTKYLSDHPTAPSRIYSTEKIFEQLSKAGRFSSTNNVIKSEPTRSIFKMIFFDNKEDSELHQKFVNVIVPRRSFSYRIISHHATDHMKTHMYGAAPHRKYRVNSPNANRKSFLINYKASVRFTAALEYKKIDDKTFYQIKKFIWDFYTTEKYPIDERMFQSFCLEYYFDKNDVINQGIKMYFRSEEDAAQFSFGLSSLFGNYLDVF